MTPTQLTNQSILSALEFFQVVDKDTGIAFVPTAQQVISALALASLPITSPALIQSSGPITLDGTTTAYVFAHNLGYMPRFRTAELRCITSDSNLGTAPGDEFTIGSNGYAGSANTQMILFANSVNLILALGTGAGFGFVGHESSFKLTPKTGVFDGISPSSFNNFALVFHFF